MPPIAAIFNSIDMNGRPEATVAFCTRQGKGCNRPFLSALTGINNHKLGATNGIEKSQRRRS